MDLFWLCMCGFILGFCIPAFNLLRKSDRAFYVYYTLYILFSGLFYLFVNIKYGSVSYHTPDIVRLFPYERAINIITVLLYFLFIKSFVSQQFSIKPLFTKLINIAIVLTTSIGPVMFMFDLIGKLDLSNLILLIGSGISQVCIWVIIYLLISTNNHTLKLMGWGILVLAIGNVMGMFFYVFDSKRSILSNPHHLVQLSVLIELGIFNYALTDSFFKDRSELIEEKIRLERKSIRAQLNPHFLFNSLSNIQRTIQKREVDNAIAYLSNFADLMRRILSASDKETHSIDQEIQLLEKYLFFEKLRFNGKFEYDIEVEDGIDTYNTMVPPLLIQPLVENALKHGFKGIDYQGRIDISIIAHDSEFVKITIEDNGVGYSISSPPGAHHESMGSAMTSRRIDLFNDNQYGLKVSSVKNTRGTKVEFLLRRKTREELKDSYQLS